MAVAALVVAIIALFIAAASAIYARTQAIAAKGSLAIERARHKGERAPRFEPAIASDGGSLVLHLRLLPGQPPMAGSGQRLCRPSGWGSGGQVASFGGRDRAQGQCQRAVRQHAVRDCLIAATSRQCTDRPHRGHGGNSQPGGWVSRQRHGQLVS
jgi:hypothetical protein